MAGFKVQIVFHSGFLNIHDGGFDFTELGRFWGDFYGLFFSPVLSGFGKLSPIAGFAIKIYRP